MNKTLNVHKTVLIAGIPLLIIAGMILLAKSSFFQLNPNSLSIGITLDLLVTVPIVYFLLIRKTTIPKTTVIPILIIGAVVCSFILPSENQYYLGLFKTWVLPMVELFALSYLVYTVRKAIKTHKQNSASSIDFFTALKKTCTEIFLKKAVIPVATEVAVFYYGFIYWKKRKLKENEFSYHKESGSVTLFAAILFMIAVETGVLHILLMRWSSTAAWILTILSVYSGIQLFGFLKSLTKRPISIENSTLYLRYGIMNETNIELKDIERIELSSKDIELTTETRKLSLLGQLESHNIVLYLKKEHTIVGLYGTQRTFKNLALFVDNKIEFTHRINDALKHT